VEVFGCSVQPDVRTAVFAAHQPRTVPFACCVGAAIAMPDMAASLSPLLHFLHFRSISAWEASLSQVPIHKLFLVAFFLFSPPHFLFCLPNCFAFKRAWRRKPRSFSAVNATASDCLNFILSFLED
jgi:hypothetical protein